MRMTIEAHRNGVLFHKETFILDKDLNNKHIPFEKRVRLKEEVVNRLLKDFVFNKLRDDAHSFQIFIRFESSMKETEVKVRVFDKPVKNEVKPVFIRPKAVYSNTNYNY